MTYPISDVTRRVVYSGSLGTGPYPFTFEILTTSDIGVYKNTTLLTLSADYTVTINADGTGSVTLTSAATSTDTISIFGNKGIQRQTDFTTGGDLFANSLNDELDAQTIFAQQNSEAILRSIRAPVTDPTTIDMVLPAKADRADSVLTFDTDGNPDATSTSDFVAGLSGAILGANYVTNNATGDGSTLNYTVSVAPGSKTNIQIYIDGVYQNKASFSVSGTTVTFTQAPPLNSSIEFMIGYAIGTTTGASGITFTQAGTGAVTRTVESKLQETVSVKDFGAKGDGVTDDSTAIQNALNSGATTIMFPSGTYICGSVLSKTLTGGELNLIGDGVVTLYSTVSVPLAGSADPAVTFLTIKGTLSSGSALSANVSAEDRTITTSESVSVGDLIRLISTDAWIPHRSNRYKKGEYCRVANVSGTTITLESPLYDSYTAATTTVYKVNAPKVFISNISFLRAAPTADDKAEGLLIRYSQMTKLDRVSVKNFTQTNIEIRDSVDVVVDQCETYGAYFAGQGEGYGVANIDCQNFTVRGGVHIGGRHGTVTGGESVTRNHLVDGVTVSSEGANSCDTHEGTASTTHRDCNIRNGIYLFGQDITIQNNRIYNKNCRAVPTISNGHITFSGNKLFGAEMEITADGDGNAISTDLVVVENNYVNTSTESAFRFNTSLDANDDWSLINFKMTNNFFKTTALGKVCCNFLGNAATATIGHLNISNNNFFSDDSLSFQIDESDFEVGSMIVHGNIFETANASSGNAKIYTGSGRATEASITDNKFFEGTSGLDYNSYLGTLFLDNNIFKNTDYSFTGKATPNFNELSSTNNVEVNVTNGWGFALQPRAVSDPGTGSVKRMVYRSSVPSSGTWERGSIVFSTTPTAGGTIGWVCVTSGTPGTWKTFGAITV